MGDKQFTIIARSGVSILDYAKVGVISQMEWPCRQFWDTRQVSCPSLWNFSNWQADVVTINLGTNDFAFGNLTQKRIREGYLSFIKDVHVQYPNTLIACIEPIIDSWFDDKPLLTGIVDGQEQAVNDMNDDKTIYYETGSTANTWLVCETDFVDYTQPTVRDNRKCCGYSCGYSYGCLCGCWYGWGCWYIIVDIGKNEDENEVVVNDDTFLLFLLLLAIIIILFFLCFYYPLRNRLLLRRYIILLPCCFHCFAKKERKKNQKKKIHSCSFF